MPSMQTTQTTEVKLSPALKKKLLLQLTKFRQLRDKINAAKAEQDQIKEEMEIAFIDAGEFNTLQAGVKMDGFHAKYVSPTRKRFDKMGAVKRGWLTTNQIAELTTEKPIKEGIKIVCPGDKEERDED